MLSLKIISQILDGASKWNKKLLDDVGTEVLSWTATGTARFDQVELKVCYIKILFEDRII